MEALVTTTRDVRVRNRFEVLRQLYRSGDVSRREIADASGLSFASVCNLVGELLALGVARETRFEDSGGGRPRGRVTVNAGYGALVGVDIAETYVQLQLFDLSLGLLASAGRDLHPEDNTPALVVSHVAAALSEALQAAGLERAGILGAGVSLPGQVQREKGVSVFAPNWGWHDVAFGDLLADALEVPVYLDNPLKASTTAELWFGVGRQHQDFAVITLGTGVGAGLALGGSLYRGSSNSAGEWGHTRLVLDGRVCRCGGSGCVEAYVGAPGILQHLRDRAPDSPLLRPDDQTASLNALALAADAGDPVALAVLTDTARYLGAGLADLVNLLNPEVVILSGWVTDRLGSLLLPEVRIAVGRHALRRPFEATRIQLCQVPEPVALGAGTLALEGFLAGIGAVTARPGAPADPAHLPTARPAP
jgi:predicted NBD/HSP70 family sugar kinase